MVAANRSLNINVTAGYLLLDFPANVPLVPGIWSSIYRDSGNKATEVEFLVLGSYQVRDFKDFKLLPHEVNPFIESILGQKVEKNHHTIEAMKFWIKNAYEEFSVCQLQQENDSAIELCQDTIWSSRSPDPKSTFEL